MTRILTLAALGTFLAAAAFAQQAPDTRENWGSRVHVYAPDYYTPQHESRPVNPDYRLDTRRR